MIKTARFLLLVLLAVLLPLRGALAEVAHCAAAAGWVAAAPVSADGGGPAPSAGPHGAADHDDHSIGMHGAEAEHGTPDMDLPAASEPAAPDASGAGHHDHSSLLTDKCHLCTASCSSTPFISALPSVAAPISIAGARYPAFTAPAPSHTSEGQERPPRSA